MMISEIISDTVLSQWLNIDYNDVPILNMGQIASLTNIISFSLIFYVIVIPSGKMGEIPTRYWLTILGVPIFSSFIIIIFDMMIVSSELPNASVYGTVLVVGLLYLNIMLFDFFEHYSDRVRLAESEKIIKNNEENYKLLESNEQDLRILKHDLTKHINVINQSLDSGDINSIRTYMKRLSEVTESIKSITYTSNLTLDSVLNIEASKAKALGIKYLVKSNIQADINIENIDLTTILSNSIDNAIEAAAKAEKKYVVITINVYSDCMDIRIENSYNPILVTSTGFETTKEDTVNHGFGMKSIKKAAEKYEGEIHNERAVGINTMNIRLKMSFTQNILK